MRYTPKHAAPKSGSTTRRVAGVALVGAATTVAGMGFGAGAAHASGVWDRVAACESGGNWSINTGNGFYGGLQFTSSTWLGYGGGAYASRADLASKSAQIAVAQKVLASQGPGAWPVCSVQAGLSGSNGGYSAPAPSTDTSSRSDSSSSSRSYDRTTPLEAFNGTEQVSRFSAGANVRSGPSTAYRVVDYAPSGTTVSGVSNGAWIKTSSGHYVSVAVTRAAAPAPEAAPAPKAESPKVNKNDVKEITVRKGDTLGEIAEKHDVKGGWKAIFKLNKGDIDDPNLIFVGQEINLPK
ncbi:transglycosylase family protein [Segeticoccus rhizosphaerae]|jgi:LysM repeat protein|uniref:transglycosylase family protein n=1 Tax=Segeticoccus rhizosphaerae TaxID=1104777 RepID=UPI0010BFF997